MGKSLQAQLAVLGNEFRTAALPDSCKQTAVWCFGQLPVLYDKLQQTNESRYADEIARLAQWMLKELAKCQKASPGSPDLAARLAGHLHLLHEQFGLPRLDLKPEKVPTPRSRKAC